MGRRRFALFRVMREDGPCDALGWGRLGSDISLRIKDGMSKEKTKEKSKENVRRKVMRKVRRRFR